jgi:uncharacterized membrane protein YjjP (DUF1212 family)
VPPVDNASVDQRPPSEPATPTLFLARLGAAMIAAGYPIGTIRQTLAAAARAYGHPGGMLVLPNHIQMTGGDRSRGITVEMANADVDLRFDQAFPLSALVDEASDGRISPGDGLAELDRIEAMKPRFPAWAFVVGYLLQSVAFALILQPNPVALGAATIFGGCIGLMALWARRSPALVQLLPVVATFVVALCSFTLGRALHLGEGSLRALAPALVMFLPGTAITLAVIELTTRDIVSGSARLIGGGLRLAQLTFGILIAAQVAGLTAGDLTVNEVARFGPWAPWVGCALYALGLFLYHGPPTRFMGWMLLILFVSYAGQLLGNALLGSYASGFGGGLALALCAAMVAQRDDTPSATTLLLPGFWLLVPGSLGFIGVTELVSNDSAGAIAVTLISMISIAVGIQSGLLVWRATREVGATVGRRTRYFRS